MPSLSLLQLPAPTASTNLFCTSVSQLLFVDKFICVILETPPISDTMYYLSLSVWLALLSVITSSCIHISGTLSVCGLWHPEVHVVLYSRPEKWSFSALRLPTRSQVWTILGLVSVLDPAVLWPKKRIYTLVLPGSDIHLWGWRWHHFSLKHRI